MTNPDLAIHEPAIFVILAQNFENLNPQTKKAAERAVKGFNGFLKNTFIEMLHQGRALNQLLVKMQQELGKSDGKITFMWWLNSEEWQHTQTLARTLMSIAKKFDKLPATLKHELKQKLNGWSLTAIKELLSAGRDVINKLKHRPTSAAEVRKEKERSLLLERPLTEDIWQELNAEYDLGQTLEKVKEETVKIARQKNASAKYKDALFALRKLGIEGIKTAKKAKEKKGAIASDVIMELANLAIRNSELKEELASAPAEVVDSIISQIKSNESRIKELRIKGAAKEDLLDNDSHNKIADLEEKVVVLKERNETLERQLQELEKSSRERGSKIEELEKDKEDLKWKLYHLEDDYKNAVVKLEKRVKEKEELGEDNRTLVRKISDLNLAQSGKDVLIETLLDLERLKTSEKPRVGMKVIVVKGKDLGMSGTIKERVGENFAIEVTAGNRSKIYSKKAEEFLIL